MQELHNKLKKSYAERLLCPRRNAPLVYSKEDGCFASILYLACKRGHLPALNQLLKEFQIEESGSNDFKCRLKEDWLQYVPRGNLRVIKKGSNNTLAALIELLVAQYLKTSGAKILNLEAWKTSTKERLPDIRYFSKGQQHNVEVKYIDQSPEDLECVVTQLKTGKPEGRWNDERATSNYYFGRIVEAIVQLQFYPYDTRQVWLIFSASSNFERNIFEENYLKNSPSWHKNTEEQKGILAMMSKSIKADIIKELPSAWLKKVPEVTFATFDSSWALKNVTHYQTSELVL